MKKILKGTMLLTLVCIPFMNGMKTETEVKENESAIKIQKNWRGYSSRKKVGSDWVDDFFRSAMEDFLRGNLNPVELKSKLEKLPPALLPFVIGRLAIIAVQNLRIKDNVPKEALCDLFALKKALLKVFFNLQDHHVSWMLKKELLDGKENKELIEPAIRFFENLKKIFDPSRSRTMGLEGLLETIRELKAISNEIGAKCSSFYLKVMFEVLGVFLGDMNGLIPLIETLGENGLTLILQEYFQKRLMQIQRGDFVNIRRPLQSFSVQSGSFSSNFIPTNFSR